MLVLSRRTDESIEIQLADGADGSMTLAQLFANGPILIKLLGGTGRRIKLGIEAPQQLSIRRRDVVQNCSDAEYSHAIGGDSVELDCAVSKIG
jgi:sRNA-binding carbon storage regulator CsrA